MSADNGIYILQTPRVGLGYEYRLAHLQAVENYLWDEKIGKQTEDLDVWIKNARKMWCGVAPMFSRAVAFQEAEKLYNEYGYVEYGIRVIEIDREF